MATITGTNNFDFLTGTGGDDRIFGLNGPDTITATSGNDFIDGGEGFDAVDYRSLSGAITLTPMGGIDKGGFGRDSLFLIERIIAAPGRANTIDASTAMGTASIDAQVGANFVNVDNIPGLGRRGFVVENFVNVIGTNNRDNLAGSAGANFLDGRGGNDGVFGLEGNDTLIGGSGTDYVVGGTGNDRLTGTDASSRGRADVDDLQGDAGNDRFVLGDRSGSYYKFNGNSDRVGIRDFSNGDLIELGLGETYRTERTGSGFQLFTVTGGSRDLIANVSTTSSANLPTGNFTIASGQVRGSFIGA